MTANELKEWMVEREFSQAGASRALNMPESTFRTWCLTKDGKGLPWYVERVLRDYDRGEKLRAAFELLFKPTLLCSDAPASEYES